MTAGTRLEHMPVGADQGNWMPSCRHSPHPVSHGQDRPALGQPAQGAFHHPPPPGRVGLLARLVHYFSSPIRRICGWSSGFGDGLVAGGIVIPLVQAQVLGAFRPLHHYALQRRPEEFRIVDISLLVVAAPPRSGGPPSPSTRIRSSGLRRSPVGLSPLSRHRLPRSVGLRSNSAPPVETRFAPWSNRRTAIPSLRRPTPGIPLSGRPRDAPAPHPLPNAGRSGGWCCHPPVPRASGSIGNHCAYGR